MPDAVIPVSEPIIRDKESKYVMECLRTGWISSEGRFIREFEQSWAAYCGVLHGVAVSNGTVALQLAVTCLDLAPDDEVIMPTFTIISCAQAVALCGGKPVLIDADPHTWCMDVNQVAAKITPRTRAIMPVHIYGHPVDMDPLLALAQAHGIVIIEDAAEAHGAEYKGRRCGSLGNLSCFSFYANKIITTGEGGMVLTDRGDWAERLRGLRNLCFQPRRRFYHTSLGFNFRLTNLQAAIGLAQLEHIDQAIAHKRWLGKAYTERLRDIVGLQLPTEEPWAKNVYWMYGVVLDESTGMDAVVFAEKLAARGVMTRPFFLGMHEQPVWRERGWFANECYPVAERLARQGLYLPSGMTLSPQQVDRVSEAVREALS